MYSTIHYILVHTSLMEKIDIVQSKLAYRTCFKVPVQNMNIHGYHGNQGVTLSPPSPPLPGKSPCGGGHISYEVCSKKSSINGTPTHFKSLFRILVKAQIAHF